MLCMKDASYYKNLVSMSKQTAHEYLLNKFRADEVSETTKAL